MVVNYSMEQHCAWVSQDNVDYAQPCSSSYIQWLDDEIINAGGEYIMQQLGSKSCDHILSCFHVKNLCNLQQQSTRYTTRRPQALDIHIHSHDIDILWLPLHVCDTHWL